MQDLVDERGHRVGRKRLAPEDHLEQHDAEREQVAAAVERHPLDLLRGHVGGAADHHAGARQVGLLADRLGDAEVAHLDPPAAPDQQVPRLDVAVDDPRLVRRGQCVGRLRGDLERLGGGREVAAREPVRERLAGDQLHHQVERLALGAGVVDADHVRVVELRGDARLALEARRDLGPVVPRRDDRRDQLHRDFAAELRIVGAVDGAHRAAPDLAADLVPPDRGGDSGRHGPDSIPGGSARRPGRSRETVRDSPAPARPCPVTVADAVT